MKIPSEKLRLYLNEQIDKPLGRLKEAQELEKVLRRRLTKKEFKLLVAQIEETPLASVMERLRLDEKRYRELKSAARRKLNRDTVKRELYEAET